VPVKSDNRSDYLPHTHPTLFTGPPHYHSELRLALTPPITLVPHIITVLIEAGPGVDHTRMAGRVSRIRGNALVCTALVGSGKTRVLKVGFGEEVGVGTVRWGVLPLD
jgi:hypothetical protein